jgi:hypothetical protein
MHIPKRNDVVAVVASYRVHNGGGNNDRQQGEYEERFQSHSAVMLHQFFVQSKLKFVRALARQTRIGSTTSGMPWL